ncbi:MAG: hypothetical protein CMP32_03145 [Rickettsiales bacterium]|nr:hypothetical protein [Rickettsiales bacterium]|tara:strand:- start:247 stop:852 length:606 start_codon:yes stop_codon:yes gene_type:complete
MWILKIGGSWIKNSQLDTMLSLIEKFVNQTIVIVTGGGCISDSIRDIFHSTDMSEETGNHLALKATEIFGYLIKEKKKKFNLISDSNKIQDRKINIWLPSQELIFCKKFKKNWESTSDSVAAWLYGKTNAEGVLFIKSLELSTQRTYNLFELQKKEILDRNLKYYLFGKKNLKIIGPEIISVMKKYQDWNKCISNFNEILI